MGRHWAWPDNTTPDAVPLERIAHWLWTSAGVTADRAQHWLEPYTQHLESGQWHSHTAQEARAQAAAKPARPCKATPGGAMGATTPGPSTTQSSTAPTSFAVVFPPVPNLGIGTLTQDDDVIMENAATVPQASSAHATTMVSSTSLVHDTAMVPSALSVYATGTVPQASSVNTAATVPQASLVNMATTVLEASSAYDTAMVPLALSVNATTMVPQASSANASAMVPPASSANTSTSMDIDAPNTSIHDMMEV